MSRSTKGPPKGRRGNGYEYWTARPGGRNPGKQTKVRTHRLERRRAKKEENPDAP